MSRIFLVPVLAAAAFAQQYPPPQYPQQQYPQQQPAYGAQGPSFAPAQLDNLVQRVALYPDPLLAEVLTAATYPDQISSAGQWASDHRYLNGDRLAAAINADRLPWQPSVVALIPFPSILDMMASDMGWTQQLGDAVLGQRPEVMDSVQHMRRQALDYGYLRDSQDARIVNAGGYIEIQPVQAGYYAVPVYNSGVVFARPARGVSFGITFGPRVFIGSGFSNWGWGGPGLDWRSHAVIIDRRPWERTWVNRAEYRHPYIAPRERFEGRAVIERHDRDREYRDYRNNRDRDRGRDRERDRDRDHQ